MPQAPLGSTYIVEEGPNPSSDYFVVPHAHLTSAKLIRCSWHELPSPAELIQATVIFVRYVPDAWRRLITSMRQQLNRLIYFMDDDLFDLAASRGLSWHYRYKLFKHAALARRWLQTMQAELWVSSNWLAHKYENHSPTLVLPKPLPSQSTFTPFQEHLNANDICRVFYHGSASHHDEIMWLYPIIKEVLKQHVNITFEIIGTGRVNRLYKSLPRVTVIHPMKWPTYQHFIATPGRHIGLAPSLDTAFNQARSYTKFFDITQSGAVGIYAKLGPAKHVLTHRINGLLVEMTHSAWIDAIGQLAQHRIARQKILTEAQALIQSFTANTKSTAT
jgi:hypothetical protein